MQSNFPSKILLATHNKGKVIEFQRLFELYGVEIIGAGSIDLPEPVETEDTFEGNALLKAKHARGYTDLPVLADDSGLSVTALHGAPGVYSARYAINEKGERDFPMAMGKLWNEIGDNNDKSAQFVAVLALVLADGTELIARGDVQGQLCYPARGDNGFGYDPIFIPENETQTFGELGAAGKDKYSHRKRSFDALIAKLSQ